MTDKEQKSLKPFQEASIAQIPRSGGIFSSDEAFEAARRRVNCLKEAQLVPKKYRENPADLFVALEIAESRDMSPIVVTQNLDVIQGKAGWSSQYVIASINACGRFTPLEFVMTAEDDQPMEVEFIETYWENREKKKRKIVETIRNRECRAVAISRATGNKIVGPVVSMKMAVEEGWYSKAGSKWKTMPELMLQYRAGSFFGRLNAPDITLGVLTTEEAQDLAIVDAQGNVIKEAEPVGQAPVVDSNEKLRQAKKAAKKSAKKEKPAETEETAESAHQGAPEPAQDAKPAEPTQEGQTAEPAGMDSLKALSEFKSEANRCSNMDDLDVAFDFVKDRLTVQAHKDAALGLYNELEAKFSAK